MDMSSGPEGGGGGPAAATPPVDEDGVAVGTPAHLRAFTDAVLAASDSGDPSLQALLLDRHYLPDATFENNFLRLSGLAAIKSHFRALARALPGPEVERGSVAMDASAGDDVTLVARSRRTYALPGPGWPLVRGACPTQVVLDVATEVVLADGKVKHHRDKWEHVRLAVGFGGWMLWGSWKEVLGWCAATAVRWLDWAGAGLAYLRCPTPQHFGSRQNSRRKLQLE